MASEMFLEMGQTPFLPMISTTMMMTMMRKKFTEPSPFNRAVHPHFTTQGNKSKCAGFLTNKESCLTPLMMKTYLCSVALHMTTTNQPCLTEQEI